MHKNFLIIIFTLCLLGCKKNKNNSVETQQMDLENIAELKLNEDNIKNVEIVFCLDATGSMSGLIGTAKEKIWDIVSDLSHSNDVDSLKLGIVFYRDRGDIFITKKTQLTTNLDNVYSDLLEINAEGGGDSPESINQALNESINDINWSNSSDNYRTIFVVGDCPPHMNYQDDVLYTESCIIAVEKGITINTIKLGNSCLEAIPHFKKIANFTNGEFMQLDQNATDYVIKTPYDDEINRISKKIDDSRLYYGSSEERKMNYADKRKSMELYEKGSSTANSSRASYKIGKSGDKLWMGSKEIIQDYKNKKIDLLRIEDKELPEILKGKSQIEKEELIKKISDERDSNILKLKDLAKKRTAYIDQKMKEKSSNDSLSFSKEIIKIMEKQATRN